MNIWITTWMSIHFGLIAELAAIAASYFTNWFNKRLLSKQPLIKIWLNMLGVVGQDSIYSANWSKLNTPIILF